MKWLPTNLNIIGGFLAGLSALVFLFLIFDRIFRREPVTWDLWAAWGYSLWVLTGFDPLRFLRGGGSGGLG